MVILLKRFEFGTNYTIGRMFLDGKFECFTLEDKVREVGAEKVPGETAIPFGTYTVILNKSQRFDRLMPLLLDVPGFEGIRIHYGNTDKDTEGCILVGANWAGTDFISNSQVAFGNVMNRLKAADAPILINITQ